MAVVVVSTMVETPIGPSPPLPSPGAAMVVVAEGGTTSTLNTLERDDFGEGREERVRDEPPSDVLKRDDRDRDEGGVVVASLAPMTILFGVVF